MIFKLTDKLKEDQLSNPVIYKQDVDVSNILLSKEDIINFFKTDKGYSKIKTWGRTPGVKEFDPHFIGTRGSTGLHTDPGYPRYTHQLKLYVDENIYTWGYDRVKTPLYRGLFYILDTYSPHEVRSENGDMMFNVSVSIDSYICIEPALVLEGMFRYLDIVKKRIFVDENL
jgi:hypothetical protein